MSRKGRAQRLHSLCSQARSEDDPRKLESLLGEIEGILLEHIKEIGESMREVEAVLNKMCRPRIH
jgi:hypothetical protein